MIKPKNLITELPPSTEADVKRAIRALLKAIGAWHYVQVQGMGSFHGISDLIGIWKERFMAIEVKAPGKKPNPNRNPPTKQQEFIADVVANGGIGFFADCLEDVIVGLDLEDRFKYGRLFK